MGGEGARVKSEHKPRDGLIHGKFCFVKLEMETVGVVICDVKRRNFDTVVTDAGEEKAGSHTSSYPESRAKWIVQRV